MERESVLLEMVQEVNLFGSDLVEMGYGVCKKQKKEEDWCWNLYSWAWVDISIGFGEHDLSLCRYFSSFFKIWIDIE